MRGGAPAEGDAVASLEAQHAQRDERVQDAVRVAVVHTVEHLQQVAPHIGADLAHHAKVVEHEAAVAVDRDVARVWVRVEKAVPPAGACSGSQ